MRAGQTYPHGRGSSAFPGFRISLSSRRVMSATTSPCGTIVASGSSDPCFREISRVPSGERASPACHSLNPLPKKKDEYTTCYTCCDTHGVQSRQGCHHAPPPPSSSIPPSLPCTCATHAGSVDAHPGEGHSPQLRCLWGNGHCGETAPLFKVPHPPQVRLLKGCLSGEGQCLKSAVSISRVE